MGETGLSDWEERQPEPVFVPSQTCDWQVHPPVDTRIQHQNLVCCVSPSGDAYCPLLVSSHRQTRSVFHCGIGDRIDVKHQIRESPYLSAELFDQYVKKAFLPVVERNRELPRCQRKPAILCCDHCYDDCRADSLRDLTGYSVLLIT
jgi:hypothetical protein